MPPERIGIEKLRAYPGSLSLAERSINPPWEDPVTMAVNAALPMVTARDRARLGLVVVASQSGTDPATPMSAWVQRYLGLSPSVRTVEMKHGSYGATVALQLAASWVASSPEECALVIATDHGLGAAAVAMLVSTRPRVIEIELGASGLFASDVDYQNSLEGAFADYVRRRPAAKDPAHFARLIYHLPLASLASARRIGCTAGASTFLALMSLIDHDDTLAAGDRIGMFAYSESSCGELWSGLVMPEAREIVRAAGLAALLDRRRAVSAEEYARVARDHWYRDYYGRTRHLIVDDKDRYSWSA